MVRDAEHRRPKGYKSAGHTKLESISVFLFPLWSVSLEVLSFLRFCFILNSEFIPQMNSWNYMHILPQG